VQRRYPERRTPVIAVGLIAGVIAGLAMLQAIWSQGRWPDRRVSSDRLAIGVAVLLVVAAAYAASGTAESLPDAQRFSVRPPSWYAATDEEVAAMRAVLEDRLTALGMRSDLHVDEDGISVFVPVQEDPATVRSILTTVGALEFVPISRLCSRHVAEGRPAPACLRWNEPLFDGARVVTARPGRDQASGEIVVELEFDEVGARLFDEHAATHIGERFAIVLYGMVQSAPTINATAFGGRAQIGGDFSQDEASALVAALHGGHDLPYPTVAVGPWPAGSRQD
jgi:preprotein translocase subunit SecD